MLRVDQVDTVIKYIISCSYRNCGWPPPPNPSRILSPIKPQKIKKRNLLGEHKRVIWPGLQTPKIPFRSSIHGMQWNHERNRGPSPPLTHKTQRVHCQCPGARHQRTASEVSCSWSDRSELFWWNKKYSIRQGGGLMFPIWFEDICYQKIM